MSSPEEFPTSKLFVHRFLQENSASGQPSMKIGRFKIIVGYTRPKSFIAFTQICILNNIPRQLDPSTIARHIVELHLHVLSRMGLGGWKGLAVMGQLLRILTTRIIFWLDKLSRTPGNAGEVQREEYVIKETL